MNKNLKKIVSLALLGTIAFSTAACGRGGTNPTQIVDKEKTQLNIFNYNGGVGTDWLYEIAGLFQEKYKNVSFEEGKMGVQVQVSPGKSVIGSMRGTAYDIAFVEATNFHSWTANGEALEITDIVTESLSEITDGKETGTIEDKLSDNQKYAFKAAKGGYYCLPHYESWPGLTYDRSVFNEYELYFAEDGGWTNVDEDKTVGPDGIRASYDDGLPSSLEEFVKLIKRMKAMEVVPMITSGAYTVLTNKLVTALYSNLVGYDEFMLNFSYGEDTVAKTTDVDTTTNIITGFKDDGTPIVENVEINMANAYLLNQQEGKYYAYDMIRTLLDEKAFSKKMTGVLTHLESQQAYIYSALDGEPIGMIIDGSYWYNEAKNIFDRSEANYGDIAKDRDFAWMPMPVQVSGSVTEGNGREPVLLDELRSFAFVNADVKGKVQEEVAKLFMQFCYTDDMLRTFTKSTSMYKGVQYEFDGEAATGLTKYAKSLATIRGKAKIVYPYTDNKIDVYAMRQMNPGIYDSYCGGADQNVVFDAMKGTKVTARDYFEGGWVSEQSWLNQYSQFIGK